MKGLSIEVILTRNDIYFSIFPTDHANSAWQQGKATQWRTFGPAKSYRKQSITASADASLCLKPETVGDFAKEREAADVLTFLSNGSTANESFDQTYAEDCWSSIDNDSVGHETDDQTDWGSAPQKNRSIIRSPYEGPGAFPCEICGKVYKWRRTLQNHKKLECGKEPQFKCPFCPLRSKRKGNLSSHIKTVHGTDAVL